MNDRPDRSRPDDDRPGDARSARNEHFARILAVPPRVLGTAALAATLLSGRAGSWAADVAVGLLVSVPLLRVAWLARRWHRRGDRRFASAALGLLVIIGVGAGIAFGA